MFNKYRSALRKWWCILALITSDSREWYSSLHLSLALFSPFRDRWLVPMIVKAAVNIAKKKLQLICPWTNYFSLFHSRILQYISVFQTGCANKSFGDDVKMQTANWVGLGWSLRFCSSKFPSDANAADPWTTLWGVICSQISISILTGSPDESCWEVFSLNTRYVLSLPTSILQLSRYQWNVQEFNSIMKLSTWS